MNKQPDTGKRAEKALESLDGIKRAEPQPFFYTRLIGRLQREKRTWWETTGAFLAKPVMVAICLGFILVFNAFILFRQDSVKEVSFSVEPGEQPVTDNEQPVADNEIMLASNSSFDYENLDQQ
jgi:hypothetical protein